jgi:hypothetical protein
VVECVAVIDLSGNESLQNRMNIVTVKVPSSSLIYFQSPEHNVALGVQHLSHSTKLSNDHNG